MEVLKNLRRKSTQCQSARPQPAVYSQLFDDDDDQKMAKKNKRKGGGKIVAAGGALVSSTASEVKQTAGAGRISIPWLLKLVFEYLGVHQLFVGQIDDDNARLFQLKKTPSIDPTVLVSRIWCITARKLELLDYRPLRYTLTDTGLTKSLRFLQSARVVQLSECRRVKFLSPIFKSFRNVTVLNLVGCSNLTDATLGVITMEIPKLSELYVAACTKLSKAAVHRQAAGSSLEILDLSANQKITDDAVERLLVDHPKLRCLYLSQIESLSEPKVYSSTLELLSIDGCEKLSFGTVLKIVENCPNLKFFNLGDNDQMLSETVKIFPKTLTYTAVTELNFSAIFHDDETIDSALANMPNLRLLECSNSEFVKTPNFRHATLEVLVCNMCYELRETALTDLQNKLPNLLHLSCNHCDSLIRPIIIHQKLGLLDLSSCSSLLSDATGVSWLNCPKLKTLFIGHTQHLTDRELEILVPFINSVTDLNLYQASSIVKPNLISLGNLWLDKLSLPKLGVIYINIDENYSDDNSEGGDPGGW